MNRYGVRIPGPGARTEAPGLSARTEPLGPDARTEAPDARAEVLGPGPSYYSRLYN